MRVMLSLTGKETGSKPQMIRARSCCASGVKFWMAGTLFAQTRRKGMNAGGQLVGDKSSGGRDLFVRGRGTDGGYVTDRKAEKYRHKAGPTER